MQETKNRHSIHHTATALPQYCYTQEEIKRFIAELYQHADLNVEALLTMYDNAKINKRYFSAPLDWFKTEHTITERNQRYAEVALSLAEQAAKTCLEKAQCKASDIDLLMVVSTSGLLTPTLDARLLSRLGCSMHTKRLPIWGLGCAGGAAGLSRANELCQSSTIQRILLISVETSSLTFQTQDLRKANLVASTLFGDGAAAVLIEKEISPSSKPGIQLLESFSTTWPDSEWVMGWEFDAHGMKVILTSEIPSLVLKRMGENVRQACQSAGRRFEEIEHFITHPGGIKVLNAFAESLQLAPEKLERSRQFLYDYGNLSSASVLFVLHQFLQDQNFQKNALGAISALGPGFSSEHLFFKTV
jgi:alkylresorcinol/alkylpyrone synthase